MSDYCHKIGHGPAMMDSDCLKADCLVCEIERLTADLRLADEVYVLQQARVEALEVTNAKLSNYMQRVEDAVKSYQATEQEGET